MNQRILSKIFIWGFLFLYLMVACISFCHAIEFFNIGNVKWMSTTLALAFEVGLALSLTAILLSDDNKKNTIPWILMGVLCLVQVIGNVYSVFKYISISESDFYLYLQKSLLFWIQGISEETVQVIISWIMGAILPVVALMMTEMVASNIRSTNKKQQEQKSEASESRDSENRIQIPEIQKESIPTNSFIENKKDTEIIPEKTKQTIENIGDRTPQKKEEVGELSEIRDNSEKETSPGDTTIDITDTKEEQQEEPQPTKESDDKKSVKQPNTGEVRKQELETKSEPDNSKDESLADYIDVLERPAKTERIRGRTTKTENQNNNTNTPKHINNQIKNFDKRGQGWYSKFNQKEE